MSHNYFTRLFKQSIGLTPYQYVIQRRVEQAKQLLIEGNLAIADMALQVGFVHKGHLMKIFRLWSDQSKFHNHLLLPTLYAQTEPIENYPLSQLSIDLTMCA